MYRWLPIEQPSDFRKLVGMLPQAFGAAEVATLLEGNVDKRCGAVLIEFGYVDKDYRSTYYNFYAKKGLRYESSCVRLHFFDHDIAFDADALELRPAKGDVSSYYSGFMVLRPTWIATIGRSVISTRLVGGFRGHIIGAWHKVHVLGKKVKIWGFPWMFQHRDVAVCAHVACWAILRHFSERYSQYGEYLTNDITRMAYGFDPGGLIPSRGLTLLHAERVFAAARTFPVMLLKPDKDPRNAFFRHLLAYIESGIPLFAALLAQKHAIAVVGHGPMRDQHLPGTDPEPLYYAADFTDELIVVDDNVAPYRRIAKGPALPYSIDSIAAFIVPLPDKVFYPAEAVDEFALRLVERAFYDIGLAPDETPVIRYFLTTAAAFRSFMAENRSQFPRELLATALQLPLTQFLWVIEVATEDQWRDHHVSFRAILDATASLADNNPLFLIHNDKKVVVINRAAAARTLESAFTRVITAPFSRMPGNFKEN